MTHEFIRLCQEMFTQEANPVQAEKMSAYLKGHFTLLGIRSPDRRKLQKHLNPEFPAKDFEAARAIVFGLWELEEREYHYYAQELYEKAHRVWPAEALEDIERLISERSWWDTVDFMASHLAGKYFTKYPDMTERLDQWNEGDHLWLQRSSIIYQLFYKEKTDEKRLFQYILRHKNSKEFFLQKAMGWALRQYGRVNADAVLAFVEEHELPRLSQREALKNLKFH